MKCSCGKKTKKNQLICPPSICSQKGQVQMYRLKAYLFDELQEKKQI